MMVLAVPPDDTAVRPAAKAKAKAKAKGHAKPKAYRRR